MPLDAIALIACVCPRKLDARRVAHTLYEVVETFARFSLLQLTIKTGRTHQIRVHLSSIKHPVVGDTLYGAPARIQRSTGTQTLPALERNFLHSAFLEFLHPRTHEPMSFSSDLPEELRGFLSQVRKLDGDS